MQYQKASELLESAALQIFNPPIGAKLPLMPKLTHYLGGLRPHEVTILCAGTGAGKTALLASIAAQLSSQGVPTFVAPVETGDTDFVVRVLSALTGRELNTGDKQEPTTLGPKLMPAIERVTKSPLYIANYDNRVSVEELKTVLEFAYKTHGVKVALLDNLNFFLEVVSSTMEKAEMDNAIHELVMFAKRFPIHTILICHPKKTDNGRVLSEYDIKGSSTAVQECANVLLFNRCTEEDLEKGLRHNDREFVFRKIRKRGMHVGKKFFMTYEDGKYTEIEYESK